MENDANSFLATLFTTIVVVAKAPLVIFASKRIVCVFFAVLISRHRYENAAAIYIIW